MRDTILTLVVLSGLPGVGKSTVARAISTRAAYCVLELDRLEAPLLRHGISGDALGWAGYEMLAVLAADLLAQGHSVIADAVHWSHALRVNYEAITREAGARYRPIEVVCSDANMHEERVEARHRGRGVGPCWADVERSRRNHWEPWVGHRLTIDSAVELDGAIDRVDSFIAGETVGP